MLKMVVKKTLGYDPYPWIVKTFLNGERIASGEFNEKEVNDLIDRLSEVVLCHTKSKWVGLCIENSGPDIEIEEQYHYFEVLTRGNQGKKFLDILFNEGVLDKN